MSSMNGSLHEYTTNIVRMWELTQNKHYAYGNMPMQGTSVTDVQLALYAWHYTPTANSE